MCVKKKELQLSYFSTCEGKKIDVKISELIALKAGSTVCSYRFFISGPRYKLDPEVVPEGQ